MQWLTPKTDWDYEIDSSGNYTGDHFNITDYNRIKNNIEYLAYVARQFWPVEIRSLPDKAYEEYAYADEINQLSDNLDAINEYVNCVIGTKTEYSANGAYIGYEDLNRIESACLAIYTAMQQLYTRYKHLPFRAGAMYWPHKNPRIPRPYVPPKQRLPFALGTRFGGLYYPFKAPAPYKEPEVITAIRQLPFRSGDMYFPFKDAQIPRQQEPEKPRLPYRTGREYYPFKLPRQPKQVRALPYVLGRSYYPFKTLKEEE